MAFGDPYTLGTISVVSGDASVTGTGVAWTDIVVGDLFFAGGAIGQVLSVGEDADTLELVLPWAGTNLTDAPYALYKWSQLRYDPALTQAKLRELLARLSGAGIIYYVTGTDPTSDGLVGNEGDFALKANASPWRFWTWTTGAWVEQATPAGVEFVDGGYSNVVTYTKNQIVTDGGKAWISIVDGNLNHTPASSPTQWELFADKGGTGATGSTGPAAWLPPVAWLTATAYVVGPPASVVTQGGETYVCLISHTSGTFATDLAASKWIKVAKKGIDGTGTGDVVGPSSATDGALVAFDTTTGKLIKELTAAQARTAAGAAANRVATLTKSADYTVVVGDHSALINLSGSHTLALTAAATLADGFKCDIRNTSTGVWVIDPNGSETVNGLTTFKVYPGENFRLICDGTAFFTVGTGTGLILLETQTASSSANLNLTRFDSSRFAGYKIEFDHIYPGTATSNMNIRSSNDGGSTYESGVSYISGTHYEAGGVAGALENLGDNQFSLSQTQGTAELNSLSGTMTVVPGGTYSTFDMVLGSLNSSGSTSRIVSIHGVIGHTTNGVRLFPTSGNLSAGSLRLYGLSKI